MKSFFYFLFFTGLPQIEGKSNYQSVNFMKFLELMKANGWFIRHLLLPKKFKQEYRSEFELESLESKMNEKTFRHIHDGKDLGPEYV